MRYLLDTCVISETRKRVPNTTLLDWLSSVNQTDMFISVVTVGELRSGARSAKEVALRPQLEQWIDRDVIPAFCSRIVGFDLETAMCWGRLFGDGVAVGHKPSVCDSMLAATAITNDMALVTRNVSDFGFPGLVVVNPFEPAVK